MTRVEEKIHLSLRLLQESCKQYPGCLDFCRCRALAEVLGYHSAFIPSKYANLEISDFTGKVGGKRVASAESVASATASFMSFCFDDPKVPKNSARSKLNSMSVMDARFSSGCSVFIYGDAPKSSAKPDSGATGKSFLAALILKEAIWRRMFKGNEALSYRFASIHDLIGEVYDKNQSDSSWLTDWLVIDDISTGVGRGMDSVLDQIISRRRTLNLPTILVLEFDASSIDIKLSDIIGHMAAKLFTDMDLCFHMRLG
jgi:DNA replication protein DnaC